jgi:hypothetical protein
MSQITTLNEFSNNTLSDATKVNQNFESLRVAVNDNFSKVTTNTSNITTNTANIATNTANITSLTTTLTTTNSTVSSLSSTVSGLSTAVSGLIGRPNWNAGSILANNTTHTIGQNGYIFFRNSGIEQATWYINSNVVGNNYGFPSAWQDCNSALFPVSAGNTAQLSGSGLIQWFPEL